MVNILGVIGGMGPMATVDFFEKIVRNTQADSDQEHLRILIDNNPQIPDRTAYICGSGEDPKPALIECARNLEKMGASFLAIPCNTAHYFYDEIVRSVNIPVLHIVREVVTLLKSKVSKVGILATNATVKTGLYQKYFEDAGIQVILPGHKDQEQVMHSIYLVKKGKIIEARNIMPDIICRLIEKGSQAIIAGCTEIPLIVNSKHQPVTIIDPTEVLAKACVRKSKEG